MERDLLLTTVAREKGDGNAQQKSATFAELVRLHMEGEDKREKLSPRHRAEVLQRMNMAADYFGEKRPETVTAEDVEEYWAHLSELPKDHVSAQYRKEGDRERLEQAASIFNELGALREVVAVQESLQGLKK